MDKNNQTQTKTTFSQKILIVLFGLIITIIILEIGLRAGGFIILSLQEHRNRLSIQRKGAYRIMCLGESTTAGRYPIFLENILNQKNIGIKFTVINKGCPGTSTLTILNKLESNLDEYHPNLVVTMMGINDSRLHLPYEKTTASKIILFLRDLRIHKLFRLICIHIVTKAQEIGFHIPKKSSQPAAQFNSSLFNIMLKPVYTGEVKYSPTEESLKKALGLNPQNDQAYLELGYIYHQQGNLPQAEESLKKALGLNPQNDQAYLELGHIYRNQGNLPQAEEFFKKALELNPKNENIYLSLGWAYRNQGNFSQSEEYLKKALELNPKNENTYLNLGWTYQSQHRFPQAEEHFKKAIDINPKKERAYLALGYFYRTQHKFSQAEEYFKKAIELNPTNERYYGALESLYTEMGSLKAAKDYSNKAQKLRLNYFHPMTVNNYLKLKEILDKRDIRLICVQYPMCNIEPLKKIFNGQQGIIFVDNERIFKEAIGKEGYNEYFMDMFGGGFGHCTDKGNRLLAGNISKVILKEVFGR